MLLAFKKGQVAAVAFGAEIAHFFTGVLPALFTWFGKNWSGIWRTAVDFALTVFINLGKNIRAIFSAIWEFMKTGKWDVAFTPITEGFRNMVQELPKIPKREMGPGDQAAGRGRRPVCRAHRGLRGLPGRTP